MYYVFCQLIIKLKLNRVFKIWQIKLDIMFYKVIYIFDKKINYNLKLCLFIQFEN